MIFSFEGNQREGKSLGATALALWLSKLVGQIPIVANYHFQNLPPGQPFVYFEKPGQLRDVVNSIIVYDEIGTSADSRTWGSKEQVLFSHVFAQMGKRGNTFIYTAQRDYLVEKRVRQQTDIVIECTKKLRNGVLYQTWINCQRGRDKGCLIGTYAVTQPQSVYSFYDTYEVIKSNVTFDKI